MSSSLFEIMFSRNQPLLVLSFACVYKKICESALKRRSRRIRNISRRGERWTCIWRAFSRWNGHFDYFNKSGVLIITSNNEEGIPKRLRWVCFLWVLPLVLCSLLAKLKDCLNITRILTVLHYTVGEKYWSPELSIFGAHKFVEKEAHTDHNLWILIAVTVAT